MKQAFKIMAMGSALAISMLAGVAQATVVTFTQSGVIYSGHDGLGIFGAPANLAGKSYQQSISTDTAFLNVSSDDPGVVSARAFGLRNITFVGTTTVEGKTYTWQVNNVVNGGIYLANRITLGETNPQWRHEQIAVGLSGTQTINNQNLRIEADNGVRSRSTPFLASTAFNQHFSIDMSKPNLVAESFFSLVNNESNECTWLVGEPGTSTWSAAAPVPEPETYAMMLAGLGLLAFTVRAKGRNVQANAPV